MGRFQRDGGRPCLPTWIPSFLLVLGFLWPWLTIDAFHSSPWCRHLLQEPAYGVDFKAKLLSVDGESSWQLHHSCLTNSPYPVALPSKSKQLLAMSPQSNHGCFLWYMLAVALCTFRRVLELQKSMSSLKNNTKAFHGLHVSLVDLSTLSLSSIQEEVSDELPLRLLCSLVSSKTMPKPSWEARARSCRS